MIEIISTLLIALGIFIFFAGALGILRFPDFYSRLHPAGMIDTLGLLLTLSGLALYVLCHHGISGASVLNAMKIMIIVVFVYITSPTATHAIVDAGIRAGLVPWSKERREGEKP